MSLRILLILAAVVTAFIFVTPVEAAPAAQPPRQTIEETTTGTTVGEVVVTSTSAFTLTVRIDEVTTVAIPLQIDWRAEGPSADVADAVVVTVSPTVLRTGFFSVTVGAVEPTSGTLAITLVEPVAEVEPITTTVVPTATVPTTATTPTTPTVPTETVPPATTGPTANTVANLRAGPGTNFAIVGSVEPGTVLDIVGQNTDGTWYVLANGGWVAAFLVDNAPTGLPVTEPVVAPLPTPTASTVVTPTGIPTVTPTP